MFRISLERRGEPGQGRRGRACPGSVALAFPGVTKNQIHVRIVTLKKGKINARFIRKAGCWRWHWYYLPQQQSRLRPLRLISVQALIAWDWHYNCIIALK